MLNYKLNAQPGFHLCRSGSTKYDNSRTGNTSLSLSSGAEWGDRHCPPLHRTRALYFISHQKEFYRAHFLTIKKSGLFIWLSSNSGFMFSYYQIRILSCALHIFRFIVITRKDIIRKSIERCY